MARTTAQRAVDAALVEVCLGRVPDLPADEAAVDDFIDGVRYHRIAPLANVALREARPQVAARLQQDRDAALLNHLRVSAMLSGIGQVLDGIPWLVFKGPVLSEFAHPIPGLRFYKDLDLLVAPGDFRTACHRLFEAGWQVVVGDDSLQSEEFPGEIPLVDRTGIVMDLHWSMLVMKSVRGRFSVAAGPLLERRHPAMIGPARLAVLDPADALVHVCHHAALIGATKLGHILDADQLARQVTDWDVLAERAGEWGATVQVAVVLGRARRLFGTPVPADLDSRLGLGAALSGFMATADPSLPIESLRHDESMIRLLTRALRPTFLRTAGVALRRAGQGLVTRVQRRSEPKPRVAPDPAVLEGYLIRVEALGTAPAAD